jgi:hypothetical protein
MKTIQGQLVKAYYDCNCKCGGEVLSESALYLPGHDQKAVSKLSNALVEAWIHNDEVKAHGLTVVIKTLSPTLQGKVFASYTKKKKAYYTKVKKKVESMKPAAAELPSQAA